MSKEKIILSANFKRDYVTTLAVGIFVLMIISELFVAISIPLAINHTSLYAEHGTRQKMISSFDSLRSACKRKNKFPDPIVTMEKNLIRTDLDMLSSHLREYGRNMPVADVEDVIKDIQSYNVIIKKLNADSPQPFCKSLSLDFSKISKRIEKQLDSNVKLEK